jgi:transposase
MISQARLPKVIDEDVRVRRGARHSHIDVLSLQSSELAALTKHWDMALEASEDQLHTFAVIPKRWIVERSFAWLEKCRRLWKNCERQLNASLQMVVTAFIVIAIKRL